MAMQTQTKKALTLPQCMDHIHDIISSLAAEARKTGADRFPNDAQFIIRWDPETDKFGWSLTKEEECRKEPGTIALAGGPLIYIRRRIGRVYNEAYQALLGTYGSVRANPDWGV